VRGWSTHTNTAIDFHGAMAVSIMSLNNLCAHQEDTSKAVRHISHSLRLLSTRLSGAHAVSDENIMAVINMVQYDRCQGEYQRGVVHVDGLLRMIQLRGGIAELARANPKLALKVFRYGNQGCARAC
jgi:transcription factor-like protein